ncbi:hypothetical protein BC831DRAFT_542352 [Entophlyctis helioformis]|nr:hypothetical protein BC831DRAFT_542352 [Entophlyctis helioformis]
MPSSNGTRASAGHPPPRRFSPYTDVNMFNLDIGQAIKSKGLKYINFAFVLSNAGVPSWGGIYDILPGQGNPIINQKVIDARSNGAEVIASFGGALGSELALANLTVSQLQSAYRVMIDFYGIRTFDFDIEGTTLNNVNATDRRLTAIKGLSSIYSDLEFIWTLPVETTGFLQNGLDFIQQSINAGIPPKLINLMTLDFGTPQPSMSNAVIVAATSARLQLLDLGLNVNLGITPMIGVNDVGGTFTLGDADIVLEFARTTSWASFLSFWSINRDNGNNNSLPESSKIEQTFLEFTTKFATFTDA